MRVFIAAALLGAVLGLVGSCGHGGCCSSANGTPAPGTGPGGPIDSGGLADRLAAIVIEGQDVPFPDSGRFGVFPPTPIMDVASDGFACFVAPVVNGGVGQSPSVLFVSQPDGTLVRTYGVGEFLDGGGDNVISSIDAVRMCPTGRVIAYVSLTGLNKFAMISVIVAAGAIGETFTMMLEMEEPPGVPGGVKSIDFDSMQVATVGDTDIVCGVYFKLTSFFDVTFLYFMRFVGEPKIPLLATGEIIPIDGRAIRSIDAFNVSEDGVTLVVAATLADPTGDIQVLIATPTVSLSYFEIARDGEVLDGGGVLSDVYKEDSPLLIRPDGTVVWQGLADGIDDIVMRANVPGLQIGGSIEELLRAGDAAPGTAGMFDTIAILNERVERDNDLFPVVWATTDDPLVPTAIYGLSRPLFPPGEPTTFTEIVKAGDTQDGTQIFSGSFELGIGTLALRDATRLTSSTAFGDSLVAGPNPSGMFYWRGEDGAMLTIALEGTVLPRTPETFGSFLGTTHTTAEAVLLFRAILTPSGTALLRQGIPPAP